MRYKKEFKGASLPFCISLCSPGQSTYHEWNEKIIHVYSMAKQFICDFLLVLMYNWCSSTHYHMLLLLSCHCVVPPFLLTHPPPKCSRWCLSLVQSRWWMYQLFPSPPRRLLVECSPPLVEWST